MQGTTLAHQLATARQDSIRVLVVGAGIAGRTVAHLLRRDGLHPVLVERAEADTDTGYMLALMPLVEPVIDALGGREEYLARSQALHRFRFRSHRGRILREDRLDALFEPFGDYRGISRGELLRVLSEPGGAVSHRTTVAALARTGSTVRATLVRGPARLEADFDLVIGADGMRSSVRDLLPGGRGSATVDTGWGGWVAWADPDDAPDLGEETWGAGFFVGSYPVRDRVGVFLGGPRRATHAGRQEFVTTVREQLTTSGGTSGRRLGQALDAVAAADDPYYWSLTDIRSHHWTAGRIALLGDAAAGFLPTAGIGAGMAMESALVLALHLRGRQRSGVPAALATYERQQRPRVESAQRTSRRLATVMFRRSRAVAALRDLAVAATGVDVALAPIRRLLADPPSIVVDEVAHARAGRRRASER